MAAPPERLRTNSRGARRSQSSGKARTPTPGRAPGGSSSDRPRFTTPNGGPQVCFHYNKESKTCKWGDTCRFQHPGHPGEEERYRKARAAQRAPSQNRSSGSAHPATQEQTAAEERLPPATAVQRRSDSARRPSRRGDGRNGSRDRRRTRSRDRSYDRRRRGDSGRRQTRSASARGSQAGNKRVCFDYLKGICHRGSSCKFAHVKMPSRTRGDSRRRNDSRGPRRSTSRGSSRSYSRGSSNNGHRRRRDGSRGSYSSYSRRR